MASSTVSVIQVKRREEKRYENGQIEQLAPYLKSQNMKNGELEKLKLMAEFG